MIIRVLKWKKYQGLIQILFDFIDVSELQVKILDCVVRLVASSNLSTELKPLVTRLRYFYSFIFFKSLDVVISTQTVPAQCGSLTASISSLASFALSFLEVYWREGCMAAAHWNQHSNRTGISGGHFMNNCINNILL